MQKTGEEKKKLEVFLVDESEVAILLTLWGDHARLLSTEVLVGKRLVCVKGGKARSEKKNPKLPWGRHVDTAVPG